MELLKREVEEWLSEVGYGADNGYVPSDFALEFITFIKLVNGDEGEENLSPVLHYKILDNIAGKKQNIANLIFRGAAKTTLLGEYLFLYIAVYGEIPGFGKVPLAVYVSDSIENGVKNMRKNLEYRYENSDFLKTYITQVKFTDIRWEFHNKNNNCFIVKGYGAKTGIRGSKEMGTRPVLAVLDDLVSDEDARSATVIASIEDTVYKAVDYALHPTRRKVIWSGTPFNTRDPLYKAVESGAWYVSVYPVCEEFPCSREDFKGAWEDRFTYDYVKGQYDKALAAGKVDSFNQELMLRIISDDDRLVTNDDIIRYSHDSVRLNRHKFNFYITTDFATSEQSASDFSIICVWAYNNNGDWLLTDGVCKRQLMDKNIDDLFRLSQKYHPQQVGVEVSGQQAGFIQWIQQEMMNRNNYFNLASDNNSSRPGIRPNTNKMQRFNIMLPQFKLHKIWIPEDIGSKFKDFQLLVNEMLTELRFASPKGFKSLHDDAIDNISMLSSMTAWKPSEITVDDDSGLWIEEDEVRSSSLNSYTV